MDFFAHGFWAGAASTAANRKLRRRLALPWVVVWGVFPDLAAFAPTFLVVIWLRFVEGLNVASHFFIFSPAARDALPAFLQPDQLYHYSHSLVIFSAVFALVWLLRRRPALVMLTWPLHILMDIPSHRAGRYGTPFLWPLSSYQFNGTSWGQRWFMILNWSAIAAAYLVLFIWSRTSRSDRKQPGEMQEVSSGGEPTSSPGVDR